MTTKSGSPSYRSRIEMALQQEEAGHEIRIQLGEVPREIGQITILNPHSKIIQKWNKLCLVTCLMSLFVDPLFFLLPSVRDNVMCFASDGWKMKLFLTVMRSVADVLCACQIYLRFRTAYAEPLSSTFVSLRGILVSDPSKIATNYLKNGFLLDLFVALPLPQVMIWGISPNLSGSETSTKYVFLLILLCQYLPRLFLMVHLSSKIVKSAGVVTATAWAGAAYNLMLSLLASHVIGACWFLQAIARQERCWHDVCTLEAHTCEYRFRDCSVVDDAARKIWYQSSNITNVCNPAKSDYPFGIYGEALTSRVTSSPFFNRYFYSLWWGLKNLSSLGQGLITSTSIDEIIFAIVIGILGLVLFALLISNMQKYLQSTAIRQEEWRTRRNDTEQWMGHRQLPEDLRRSVRGYEQYKWEVTSGVDEDAFLKGLPVDLHRRIRRHLGLHLIRRVPLLAVMDETVQDLLLERLKPALYLPYTLLVREGHPVREMIFIIRGQLSSFFASTNQSVINTCHIGPGDFCGDGLLTWSLHPRAKNALPLSPRTVQAIEAVEAFVITAEDLRIVGAHIRFNKKLHHTFRFYSFQWRTWAACLIQENWRRHRRQRNAGSAR